MERVIDPRDMTHQANSPQALGAQRVTRRSEANGAGAPILLRKLALSSRILAASASEEVLARANQSPDRNGAVIFAAKG